MSLLKKYNELILEPKPSKLWQSTRFILHWLTLPLKLVAIGGLGGFQIVSKALTLKPRRQPDKYTYFQSGNVQKVTENGLGGITIEDVTEKRKGYFEKVFDRLPIFHTTEIKLYTNRVPYYSIPNGSNHNPDHQCARHSTFAFLLSRLGIQDDLVDKATWMHMQGKWLSRGYNYTPEGLHYNVGTVSGDMLCGLNLAVLTTKNEIIKDRFEEIVNGIIDNDYSLLEGQSPEKQDPGYDLYQAKLKAAGYATEKVEMKSARGMWQPGLETVGAQALTVLAALRVADKKCGSPTAKKEYRNLLFKYGYGLLSLIPTAYTDSRRGYYNEHNCLIALYVLSQLSDSKLGRLFWKIPMVYVWALSKHWYNGYFTGLLNDAHPGTVSEKYIEQCKNYLYENEPRTYGYEYYSEAQVGNTEQPVTYNELAEDEFSPDIKHNVRVVNGVENTKYKTGLGYIASAIMLEKDPRKLIE